MKALLSNYAATVVLVTGGTGFLGSILIKRLLASGMAVRAAKRETSVIPQELVDLPALEWVNADINDFFALGDAFIGISKVYHCAGMISYHAADRQRLTTVNVAGTANVVNLALQHRTRLLHVSSIAAIGQPRHNGEATEDDLWEYTPGQPGYAASKYEGEMEVWRGVAEGLDAVIVNPALIIGPSARAEGGDTSGSIFAMVHKGLHFYTDGSVGLIDVEDTAKAMVLLMDNPTITGQRFLLSNANMTYRELLARCSNLLGRPAPKYRATPWMLSMAWRAASVLAWFTRKRPLITRETANSARNRLRFSNRKVVAVTGIAFKPIDHTLNEICKTLK
ncbi:NAD-dependent epimerase/dehydratase family protein [Parapedobacter sp. 10938]|uniref:NAD-dependent epimerase/dehydratase family protein n=1 Tax=Parapedobacter flavus TaxID=3110225 RepID=UPI002DBD06D0|nr:NAD-dependent epimerase/dehydratase family protein [Parapedobacter sp. 10938]MEC3878039.1 NAD-dependent epimerase/dehydratase family protein [Parapedobacter sp. 10938]